MFWCFIYVGPTLRISSHHIDLWKRFEVCFIAAGVDGNLEPDDPPILLIWFKPAATVLSDIVCGRQVNSAGPDLLSTPAHRGSAQRLGSSFNPPVFLFLLSIHSHIRDRQIHSYWQRLLQLHRFFVLSIISKQQTPWIILYVRMSLRYRFILIFILTNQFLFVSFK